MFIGRERELATLNKLYASDKFEFVVIYGRRRVGKTALISQFIDDKNAIYFIGVESNAKQNLENFSKSILSFHTGMDAETSFLSFQAALEYVFKLSEKERIILFVGRMEDIKGGHFLVRTFMKVLEDYPESRLMIIGDGNYDLFLRNAKPFFTKITFTGLLNKEDLYELYRLADVGVVPSLFEPFGYVPVEMMMHELPIIATATSGLNEVVDESCALKIPLIVSSDSVEIDVSLLAEKILYLLQNPEEAKRLGKNGRKRYLEKYSSEVFRENMLTFYKSLWP